jgi:Fe-S oxidoreductase
MAGRGPARGKIKIDPAKRIKQLVTLQDSCNYIRNYGLKAITREILSYLVEPGYFVEMSPNKEHNYCCGGGGGFNGMGIFRPQRNRALMVKRDQILATAKLVAPCHNCWDAIRDLEEEFKIGIKWTFLKPLVIHMMEVPEHLKPKEEEE